MTYRRILIAVDATEEANEVIKGALRVADSDTLLHLMTVVEPLSHVYSGMIWSQMGSDVSDIESSLRSDSSERLQSLATEHGLDPNNTKVSLGSPSVVIRQQAEELETDLIVVGSHARHGVGLLLGSTANSVLHGVTKDVLVIRLGR